MMKTPIVDFVREYAQKSSVRLHMPGHKGVGSIGCEKYDVTEITGADVLYSPDGIILESENNASELFGTAHSFYSAEGSSLCIKAMLMLATRGENKRQVVMAARNTHKAFIYAAALLDLDIEWLYPASREHICRCDITPEVLDLALKSSKRDVGAVYVTSPDYLGNMLDIKGLSEVCHRHGVLLLVDNAHGAYLKFCEGAFEGVAHPITLGADMCCDSAHKTLPVLTGGAYLHVSKAVSELCSDARRALSLFASTSPSYLILQSLDACNAYIEGNYRDRLKHACNRVAQIKRTLVNKGLALVGDEPLKITVHASECGLSGETVAKTLRKQGIEIEFFDRDVAVMMITPENTEDELSRLEAALIKIDPGESNAPCDCLPVCISRPQRKMSIREAIMSPAEIISVWDAKGRVCADPCVSCPPAVPIAVSGEVIGDEQIKLLSYYKKDKISVVK